jgi:hypothetical protein
MPYGVPDLVMDLIVCNVLGASLGLGPSLIEAKLGTQT